MNAELLHTAMLGTARRPLTLHLFTEEVLQILASFPDSDPESQLLRATYCMLLRDMAGAEASKAGPHQASRPVEEVLDFAPEQLDALLVKICQLPTAERNHLLRICMTIYLGSNWIIAPRNSLALLKITQDLPRDLSTTTLQILSERAKSILPFLKNSAQLTTLHVDQWHFGTIQDRKAFFEQLLLKDRPSARALLDQTFLSEPLSFQRSILEMVIRNYLDADRSTLEQILKTRFAYRTNEKAIEKSLRYLLTARLLSDNQSEPYQLASSNLSKYFVPSGSIWQLLGSKTNKLLLPDAFDDFWNKDFMERNFGFETEQYDIALYKNIQQFWLAEFIRFLPVDFWCTQLQLKLLDTLVYFNRNEAFIVKLEGKMIAIYYPSFLENANFTKNRVLAKILIEHDKKNETAPLLHLLSTIEFEEYIHQHEQYLNEDAMKYGSYLQSTNDWSQKFSETILQKSYTWLVQERRYIPGKILGWLLQYCNPKAEKMLEYLYQLENQSVYHVELWKNQVYQPLSTVLQLKKNLEYYK